ncbi:MAG: hypothetical protein JWM95_3392 [Gemmatimonadetes bacterium]|nr:hypothetical protein [Gemmatimonadota bacterium]
MGAVTLDGPGVQKMKTIEEALTLLARLNAIVELYALSLKQNKPTSMFGMQVKRALFPLVGLLKPQFGLIADQVSSITLIATRGGSETAKIRVLREGVASIRMQLDIAIVRIKENHKVEEEVKPGARKPGE